MRALLPFLLLMTLALVAGALLAYPVFELGSSVGAGWPFHRVATRLAMLFLLLGFLLLVRRMRLANRAALGYGIERSRFVTTAVLWLGVGALSMLPVVALLIVLGIRTPETTIDTASVAGVLLSGLLSGLVVATIEETFLRGAMFTAIERESGSWAAIVLTALVYSTLHFLNRAKIAAAEVGPGSGLDLLSGTLDTLARPASIVDSFLALFAVGVLLGIVRARSRHIAACIGLHAGWVWVIAVAREVTQRDPNAPLAWLVGSYDGIVGWFVLVWAALLAGAAAFIPRRPGPGVRPPTA